MMHEDKDSKDLNGGPVGIKIEVNEQDFELNENIPSEDVLKENTNEDENMQDQKSIDVNMQDQKSNDTNTEFNGEEYDYLKLDVYTSEKFKIEIQNLPKYCNHLELKKLFKNKLKLELKKVKVVQDIRRRTTIAYISLSNDDERAKALEQLNGYEYKGCRLRAAKAKPAADPRIRNRERSENQNRINYDELEDAVLQELLLDQVCPLHAADYTISQLATKQNLHRALLEKILNEIKQMHINNQNVDTISLKSANYDRNRYLARHPKLSDLYRGMKSANDAIVGYRNKCEFNVNTDTASNRTVVGFRLGSFLDNKIKVVKPLNCPLVNERMSKMINCFETFFNCETTNLKPYDCITHQGHLKHLTVRTTETGGMVIVVMNRTGLDDETFANEINKLSQFVRLNEPLCTSIYVQFGELQKNESKTSDLLKHVYGETHLYQMMQNERLQFRISPLAFFQVNVAACEILYETVADLANLNTNTILLDICCGVGTIGIFLANKVKHVLAVELCKEAIDDAKHNAQLNNIKNIDFFAGFAEDNLHKMLNKARRINSTCEIVAILDPPRPGLKNSIIKAIRNCNDITKLIYVSCEPKLSRQNLIGLCKIPTKAYPGSPFNLVQAVSVDMFPHTFQCELITLFTREISHLKAEDSLNAKESEAHSNIASEKAIENFSSPNDVVVGASSACESGNEVTSSELNNIVVKVEKNSGHSSDDHSANQDQQ